MQTVSVVIPTRNRAEMVQEAIASVLAQQTAELALEVIVIDDGSTDNTAEVVRRFPVKYLVGKGQGVSTARNIGLAAATGEFIAFLDDDDAWSAGYPGLQTRVLNAHPEYGAVISQIMMADENLRPTAGPFPEEPLTAGWMFDAFLYYVPCVASAVVRASVMRDIGGFDATLRGSEDWDWMLKIAKRYQIGFVPEVSMLVRQHRKGRVFLKENEEDMLWRRFTDTMSVYWRHTHKLPLQKQIKLQRRFWKLRGWYVPFFMQIAATYAGDKNIKKASKSLLLAARASWLHTALYLYRSRVGS